MNILLLNQNWFAEEFRRAGHKVLSIGIRSELDVQLASICEDISEVGKKLNFEPDCVIALDESAPLLFTGFERLEIPALFYSVDTHHHADIHQHTAKLFDITYVAQSDYISAFKDSKRDVRWFPLWASRYVEAQQKKKYGAVFVGTLNPRLNPDRVEFFEALQQASPVMVTSGDWAEIFPYSEIVINQTVKGDLNFRVFEAMMTGALLLTEDTENGLKSLFNPGEHLVTYKKGDVADAAAKIKYYLEHLDECHAIAKAGRDEILKNHTEAARAQQILSDLEVAPLKRHHDQSFYANVPNLVWLSNIFAKSSKVDNLPLLERALWYVAQANAHQEKLDQSLTNYVAAACLKFDQKLGVDVGKKILKAVCATNLEYGTITMVHIWLLDKFESRKKALEYIQTIPLPMPAEAVIQASYEYISWLENNDGVADHIQSVMHPS